jgi:hypothetical protein
MLKNYGFSLWKNQYKNDEQLKIRGINLCGIIKRLAHVAL